MRRHQRSCGPNPAGRLPARRGRAAVGAALLVAALALLPGASALALELRGEVTGRSPVAAHAVWLVTDLDLTAPGQPVVVAPVDEATGEFALRWDGPRDAPYWLFLRQRFHPEGGPPVDLYLPRSLLPEVGEPDGPLRFAAVDPELLMRRERFSTRPSVLLRLGILALLVFGGGLLGRRLLRPFARGPGPACAPLADAPPAPEVTRRERVLLGAILALAVALRSLGMGSESLELLEVSYLPGIGRPTPFGGAAGGLAGLPGMLLELGQLYCLDLVHPPLYHALTGLLGLWGREPFLLRLPGMLASLATLVLLWRMLRTRGRATGLAAAAVFAGAAPAVYFGQDATPYALVGLCAVGSFALALSALRSGSRRAWTGFFALLVAGVLSHYNVAFVGAAAIGGLLAAAWLGRRDRRWPAALHLALGPALALAPLPVGWAWLHFSTFPTVAQDTRLVADTYAPDPGAWAFLTDFFAVTGGIRADGPAWASLALAVLAALGLHRALRPRDAAGREDDSDPAEQSLREVPATLRESRGPAATTEGLLTLAFAGVFVVSVFFFYDNVRTHLGGRVFYGFRWVSWFHPVLLALGALGWTRGVLPRALRGLLAAAWIAGLAHGTAHQTLAPSRPDYDRTADLILTELADRDAVASVPAWFQRGTVGLYILEKVRAGRSNDDGPAVWALGRRRFTIEAIHPSLPFETTARNGHHDRLWLVDVRETMFGRDKFMAEVAEQAIRWADEHLEPDGAWEFDLVRVRRYRIPQEPLRRPPGTTLVLGGDDIVHHARVYPQLERPTGRFLPPDPAALARPLGPTSRYQAPMAPSCSDWEWTRLSDALAPDADTHWFLELALPLGPEEPEPEVIRRTAGQVHVRREGDRLRITGVGRPCTEPALAVEIRDRD